MTEFITSPPALPATHPARAAREGDVRFVAWCQCGDCECNASVGRFLTWESARAAETPGALCSFCTAYPVVDETRESR